jgi:hypothetical protein
MGAINFGEAFTPRSSRGIGCVYTDARLEKYRAKITKWAIRYYLKYLVPYVRSIKVM